MLNNFNCSSSGINIEVNCQYDTDLSSINFNECFYRLQEDTWIYNPYGELQKYTSLFDLYNLADKDQTSELKYALSDAFSYGSFEWASDQESLWIEFVNNYRLSQIKDFVSDCQSYKIDIVPKFLRTTSRGYSQGDYVEVFIPLELKDIFGMDIFSIDDFQQDIDSILWDAPMRVRTTINNEEFISEEFDGQYEIWNKLEYNKDIFIEEIMSSYRLQNKQATWLHALYTELQSVVPNKLDYK